MLPSFAYARPRSVSEAIERLSTEGARLHAGGTDLLGCLRDGVFAATQLVALGGIQELRGVRESDEGGLVIGASTTIREVADHPVVRERYEGLARAASEVASPQLRNQGTLGGNLCQRPRCWYFRGDFHCAKKGGDLCYAFGGENRYHAILGGGPCFIVHPSDTAPALLALGASVRVAGPHGERVVPLDEFFVLPAERLQQENVLESNQIVTEIVLPPPAAGTRSSYRKVRERGSWDFALASVALSLRMSGKRVEQARIVLGGVAPIPWRARDAERAIVGRELDAASASAAADAATAGAAPLEQNAYKVLLVRGIVEESLLAL